MEPDNDDAANADAMLQTPPQLAHLSLRLNAIKHLVSMLSAIYNGKKDSYVTLAANSHGGDTIEFVILRVAA